MSCKRRKPRACSHRWRLNLNRSKESQVTPPKPEAKPKPQPKADPVAANVSKLNNRVAALEAEVAALKSALGAQLNITL